MPNVPSLAGLAVLVATSVGSAQVQPDLARATFDSAWSTIDRTYWDTTFVRGRWRAIHDSLRPLAAAARDDESLRRVLGVLVAAPGQSHFGVIPRELVPVPGGGATARGGAGMDLRLADGRLVVWRVDSAGPAARAGFSPGLEVVAINGRSVDSLRQSIAAATPDGFAADRLVLQIAAGRLAGSVGDSVRIRTAGARDRVVSLAAPSGQVTQFGNLPALAVSVSSGVREVRAAAGGTRRIGVIGLTAWFPAVARDFDRAIDAARGLDGIVIDLRGNPGGVIGMLAGVAGHFIDTAASLGAVRGRQLSMRFAVNPRRVTVDGTPTVPFRGPVGILIDPMTASTSEFFAAGLQALGRARVFGEVSAGQALPSLMVRLPNGDVLMHPIADHLDAAGRRVEGVGVRPDVMAPLVAADLRAGRDGPLDAALAWLAETAQQ